MPTEATEASGQQAALQSLAAGNTDLARLGTVLAGVKAGVMPALETIATGNPDLRRLGRLLAGRKPARIAALRNFVNDNPDLGRLKDLNGEQLAEFDLFEALDLYGKEEVPSRFLVWLLDPQQNHGAGDYFLRHFLLATGAATPDEVHDLDWSTTSVRREWLAVVDGAPGYLDILLVNHREQDILVRGLQLWHEPADPLPPRAGKGLLRFLQAPRIPVAPGGAPTAATRPGSAALATGQIYLSAGSFARVIRCTNAIFKCGFEHLPAQGDPDRVSITTPLAGSEVLPSFWESNTSPGLQANGRGMASELRRQPRFADRSDRSRAFRPCRPRVCTLPTTFALVAAAGWSARRWPQGPAAPPV